MVDVLAMPVLVGRKTAPERFAGAVNTLTCRGDDGRRQGAADGHQPRAGQNFAKAFDITYLDDRATQQTCWTTSWGVSTRMVGGLIMAHGDDTGLRVPPRLAPIQVVVLLVRDEDGAGEAARGPGRRAPGGRRAGPRSTTRWPPASGAGPSTGS